MLQRRRPTSGERIRAGVLAVSASRRRYGEKKGGGGGREERRSAPRRRPALLLFAVGVVPAWLALNAILELSGVDEWLVKRVVGAPLNPSSFVPFTVVSREQVSPTSFILTVKPKFNRDGAEGKGTTAAGLALSVLFPRLEFPRASHTNRPVLEAAWDHGLWSVEIKQPQLQVARDYTPLPPSSPGEGERDLEQGRLRFLIRKMDGGEVSTYLSRLRIGDAVELRGPHLGFDVRARLGSADRIVFLAGGTGIAPALQTVRAVLETDGSGSRSPAPNSTKPTVFILWANRHRTDCPGVGPPPIASSSSSRTETQSATTNAIVSLLAQLEARHGDKLRFVATVDEENTFISPDDILDATTTTATTHPKPDNKSTRWLPQWWPWNHRKVRLPLALAPNQPGSSACRYHSATLLASSDGRDPPAAAASIIEACGCAIAEGAGEGIAGGGNLLMVSGPEGFIGAYAGPKRWANGKELQGAVGGTAGALLQAASSGIAREQGASWMVLKL